MPSSNRNSQTILQPSDSKSNTLMSTSSTKSSSTCYYQQRQSTWGQHCSESTSFLSTAKSKGAQAPLSSNMVSSSLYEDISNNETKSQNVVIPPHFPCAKSSDVTPLLIAYESINPVSRETQRSWVKFASKRDTEANIEEEKKSSGNWDRIEKEFRKHGMKPNYDHFTLRVQVTEDWNVSIYTVSLLCLPIICTI